MNFFTALLPNRVHFKELHLPIDEGHDSFSQAMSTKKVLAAQSFISVLSSNHFWGSFIWCCTPVFLRRFGLKDIPLQRFSTKKGCTESNGIVESLAGTLLMVVSIFPVPTMSNHYSQNSSLPLSLLSDVMKKGRFLFECWVNGMIILLVYIN